jgi:peptide/nickel transport system substrate-binding protein
MKTGVCHSASRLIALLVFLSSASLIGLAAQPPREQEDPKSKPAKKIVVEDEDTKGPSKKKITVDDDPVINKKGGEGSAGTAPDERLDELVRAAEEARTTSLKDLFTKYINPFDRIVETNGASRIKPIPIRKSEWGGHETVSVTPLDNEGKPREPRAAKVAEVKNVEHFEMLILSEVEKLQKQKLEGLTPIDQLGAADKLLSAALRFHDYSRIARNVEGKPKNLRRGKGWDELRDSMATKLRGVQLELLKALGSANDQIRLKELTARMVNLYVKDEEVAHAIAGVQVAEADRLLKSGSDQDLIAARRIVDELEGVYPGIGGETAKKIRTQLRDTALKSLNRAREKKAAGDDRTARDELARTIALDPDLDGIREMQKLLQVEYPMLYVGVRQYPKNMSPATARLDSEKQAVELIFEGLLEEVPDESGAVRYRPGAALNMPTSVFGGREFLLRAFDRDASGRPGFDSHDVVGTVTMLRSGQALQSWAAYPLIWLAPEPPAPKDNSTVRITFGLPHPDPRTALTFKLLPTRWLAENGRAIDDERFAENPFGTGPFKLQPRPDASSALREMVFVNNPAYSRYGDRKGLPNLREVRFVEADKIDPIRAFQEGKLHILPDLPTADIDRYTGPNSSVRSKVDVVTAAVNRRVHILAVNLNRPYLQSKQLRQGISLAIDRDDILRKVFRSEKPEFHKQMTGPFPPNSWATYRGVAGPPPLMNRDLAMVRLKGYLSDQGAPSGIELAYPEDDPRAEKACEEIKHQIEVLFKNEPPGSRKLTINLVKSPHRDLLVKVQDQHTNFDLAYMPFDYPDDWYPYALGAALDPSAAVRGGRNWFGFLVRDTGPDAGDDELGRALNKMRLYRDFVGEIVPQTYNVSRLFNDSLPFIPLWQLDRHMVVSKRVKVFVDDDGEQINPRLLNQTTLFQGVGRWKVE